MNLEYIIKNLSKSLENREFKEIRDLLNELHHKETTCLKKYQLDYSTEKIGLQIERDKGLLTAKEFCEKINESTERAKNYIVNMRIFNEDINYGYKKITENMDEDNKIVIGKNKIKKIFSINGNTKLIKTLKFSGYIMDFVEELLYKETIQGYEFTVKFFENIPKKGNTKVNIKVQKDKECIFFRLDIDKKNQIEAIARKSVNINNEYIENNVFEELTVNDLLTLNSEKNNELSLLLNDKEFSFKNDELYEIFKIGLKNFIKEGMKEMKNKKEVKLK